MPRNIAGCCTQQNIGEVARSDGGVKKDPIVFWLSWLSLNNLLSLNGIFKATIYVLRHFSDIAKEYNRIFFEKNDEM